MKKGLKILYKILRAVVMTAIVLAIIVPTSLYIALSLPSVQNAIREYAEEILSYQLNADVTIEKLIIQPFNRAQLRGVVVCVNNDTVMKVSRIGAGFDLSELTFNQRIALNYAEIIDPDIRIWRDSIGAPLNIQPIIDKLAENRDPNNSPSKTNIRVNTLILRRGSLTYDVKNAPETPDRFDPNHIHITDLRADINAPVIQNRTFNIDLRRLAFREASGLDVENLHAVVNVTDKSIDWSDLEISLPDSRLNFANNSIPINSLDSIKQSIAQNGLTINLLKNSRIYLPDIKPFIGEIGDIPAAFGISLKASLSPSDINIDDLSLADNLGLVNFNISNGRISNFNNPDLLAFNFDNVKFSAGDMFFRLIEASGLSPVEQINQLHSLDIDASANGNLYAGELSGALRANDGKIDLSGSYNRADDSSPITFNADVNIDNVDLNAYLNRTDLGILNAKAAASGTVGRNIVDAKASLLLSDFTFRDHIYESIEAQGSYANGNYSAEINIDDPMAMLNIAADGSIKKDREFLRADLNIADLNLHSLNLLNKYPGYTINFDGNIDITGNPLQNFDGRILLENFRFENPNEKSFDINSLEILAEASDLPRSITVKSDLINGNINGDFNFATIATDVKRLIFTSMPDLAPEGYVAHTPTAKSNKPLNVNDFNFEFVVDDTEKISAFFNLPVTVIYPLTIAGNLDAPSNSATIDINAPFIRQGNKLIEQTRLLATLDGNNDRLKINTSYPSADGLMDFEINADAADNNFNLDLDWIIRREAHYNGNASFAGNIFRDHDNRLGVNVNINPSEMMFNDSTWIIHPASILLDGDRKINVDNIFVTRNNQFVKINGVVSDAPSDSLNIDLLNIDLDYIFTALHIDAVMLMGDASGTVHASQLLSPDPHIVTDGIKVTDIGYNGCRLGNAIVKSHWNMEKKAVEIDGTITQDNGKIAKVIGSIYPAISELDFEFLADQTPLGFMGKYMAAFASDVTGEGSGYARIFGNFHDINMEGDLYAENLRLKLNFTNTYYNAQDSVKIRPGIIHLKDITLRDDEGHTALLNGVVTHDYFRDPTFNFELSNAKNLLVYNETRKENPDWFGKIYVNGGASIIGEPGIVTIDVNAKTAPGSIFTYVLSEMEIADEYTFLTFRDKNHVESLDEEIIVDEKMSLVDQFRAQQQKQSLPTPTNYIIKIQIDITPAAEVDLIMDPVAGDIIRSHGDGNMRMVYDYATNNLEMYGKYILADGGKYKFTLQDIIVKDFDIEKGSSITFDGDPLQAKLVVKAYYELRANLSDLDESFLQDKDLSRTNVPVRAVLNVEGNLDQQKLSFNLEFPTLSSDVYNKVKSIVSTEDMLTRQIIYLLALNRFYTPEYMGSTTKGNELFSVASSTITSQMSNILGGLSDNWTISPNLRSDKGDFSDVEVDVALSSRLLNNRLLLNGNFGYRDNSLNNNQFIGDFEIQYLLNRSGSLRLKAYSYSNDEAYYVRTAATTQGVGVMFKRDFDNIFSFLRRSKKPLPADSLPVLPTPIDSIAIPASPSDSTSILNASNPITNN